MDAHAHDRSGSAGAGMTSPREPHGSGLVMVGVSGRETSLAPIRAAAGIARRQGRRVELVVVYEPRMPLPLHAGEEHARLDSDVIRREAHRVLERVRAARHQVALEYPEADEWMIHLEVGDAPARIARAAHREGASLVVVGLGRPGDPTGRQLARRLMYLCDVPILGVAPDAPTEFSGVVVDTGHCAAGLRVAHMALTMLLPGGELHLVSAAAGCGRATPGHMPPGTGNVIDDPEAVRRALEPHPEVVIRTARLDGDPSAQLLAYSTQLAIPLVATAVEGRTATERTLLRNLGPALLRARRGAVLLVPPAVVHDAFARVTATHVTPGWPAITVPGSVVR